MGKQIRILKSGGTPYDIGYKHGSTYRELIRAFARDRVELVSSGVWTGGKVVPRAEVLEIAAACIDAHGEYSPELFEELRGLADAADLSLSEMIIVGGFTDFIDVIYNIHHQWGEKLTSLPIDDCTAFLVPDSHAEGAGGFFGQTWDMHDTATQYVIMLQVEPDNAPNALVFTTTGCVGQIGMNEHGIAVGINNLMGADGQTGVTWPFVVRKVLLQENIEDALKCITEANLAGAHNYLLFDKHGNGYNIEAMSSMTHVEKLEEHSIVHTNHCLIPETRALSQERPKASQESSEMRLSRAYDLLKNPAVTANDLMALTADEPTICVSASPPLHVESCGAAIMRPSTGEMWAVWGKPSENSYERFTI